MMETLDFGSQDHHDAVVCSPALIWTFFFMFWVESTAESKTVPFIWKESSHAERENSGTRSATLENTTFF